MEIEYYAYKGLKILIDLDEIQVIKYYFKFRGVHMEAVKNKLFDKVKYRIGEALVNELLKKLGEQDE